MTEPLRAPPRADTAYTAFVKEGPLIDVAKRVLGLDSAAGGGGRGGRGGRGDRGGGGRGRRGAAYGPVGGGHGTLTRLHESQAINLRRLLKGARCVPLQLLLSLARLD